MLADTNLTLERGMQLLVVGANASGKTALLSALGGGEVGARVAAGARAARDGARVASVSFDAHRRFAAQPKLC